MPEQDPNGGAPAQSGVTTSGSDQVPSGAATAVDLEATVAELARKSEREAQKKVSIDLIDNPEHRKIAERLQSQAITEYRKKLEQGTDEEFVSKHQVESMLRNERRSMKAEQEATERHRDLLTEYEIKKGTEDYEKFSSAALKFLDKTKLGDREAIEMLARGLGVGKFKPREEMPAGGRPFLPPGGSPLRVDATGKTVTSGDPDMDATLAAYAKQPRR